MTERGTLRRHIKALERRSDFLGQRIGQGRDQGTTNWDKGELAALRVALELMEERLRCLPPDSSSSRR